MSHCHDVGGDGISIAMCIRSQNRHDVYSMLAIWKANTSELIVILSNSLCNKARAGRLSDVLNALKGNDINSDVLKYIAW